MRSSTAAREFQSPLWEWGREFKTRVGGKRTTYLRWLHAYDLGRGRPLHMPLLWLESCPPHDAEVDGSLVHYERLFFFIVTLPQDRGTLRVRLALSWKAAREHGPLEVSWNEW